MHTNHPGRRLRRRRTGPRSALFRQPEHNTRATATSIRSKAWTLVARRARLLLGWAGRSASTSTTEGTVEEAAPAAIVDDVHIPAVSEGPGQPVDEARWCINLGVAIRLAKRVLQAADRKAGQRQRGGELEPVTALRALVNILEQPLDAVHGAGSTTNGEAAGRFEFVIRDPAARAEFEPWTDGMAVGFRCKRAADDRAEYLYLLPSDGWTGDVGSVSLLRGRTGVPGRDELVHCYLLGVPTLPATDDPTPRPDAA